MNLCRQLDEKYAAVESAVEQFEYQQDELLLWKSQLDFASDQAAHLLGEHDDALVQIKWGSHLHLRESHVL